MRGESKFGIALLVVGLVPALIKKSKPLSRYVGDHLIKTGEYLIKDTETEEVVEAPVQKAEEPVATLTEEPVKPAPKPKPTPKPKEPTSKEPASKSTAKKPTATKTVKKIK